MTERLVDSQNIGDLSCEDKLNIAEDKLDIAINALDYISGALDSWNHEEALHRVVDLAQATLMEITLQ